MVDAYNETRWVARPNGEGIQVCFVIESHHRNGRMLDMGTAAASVSDLFGSTYVSRSYTCQCSALSMSYIILITGVPFSSHARLGQ